MYKQLSEFQEKLIRVSVLIDIHNGPHFLQHKSVFAST